MWDWRLFDEGPNEEIRIFLYKLHGSLDWSFAEDGTVSYSDSPSKIADERVALIFGTSYKLQYVDPFLFLAYQLRRWTLDAARLVVAIGYGFMDEHITEYSVRRSARTPAGVCWQSLRRKWKWPRQRSSLRISSMHNASRCWWTRVERVASWKSGCRWKNWRASSPRRKT